MTGKLPAKTFALHPRKKIGLILGILISAFMAVLWVHIFINLDRMPGKIVTIILFLASIGTLVFNIIAYVVLSREHFIGFFISADGLYDISTGNNYGIVYWKDVLKMRIVDDLEHPKFKYIVLKVKDPQQYIDREPLIAKKRSLMLKYHYYGSPVCFSNRGLNCPFEDLEACVRMYYDNYQKRENEKLRPLQE
jgi:hypothetical protein